MAGMKQAAIKEIVAGIEPGDEFEIVFGGNATTLAAGELLRMGTSHTVELTQPLAQGMLWVVSASRSWQSRQNRTYRFIAGTHWNAERFMRIIGKALESIEITSQAPREPAMLETDVVEMLQLAGQGDCIRIRLKNLTAKDVAWVPIKMARQSMIQLLDDSEHRLVRVQVERPHVHADLRTFSCKVLTNLEFLIPYASWIGQVEEVDSQIYMCEDTDEADTNNVAATAEAC